MYEKCKNISVPTSIAAQVKNLQVRIRYVNVQFSQKLYGNKIHRGVFLQCASIILKAQRYIHM